MSANIESSDAATPLAVSVDTARQLTGLGTTTIWGLIKEGRLEVARVGRRTLILYRSLQRLLSLPSEAMQLPRRRGRPRKIETSAPLNAA
jgi:excisionase family DNA binding protein